MGAADVVVCATSARTPLFDSTLLRPDSVVIRWDRTSPTPARWTAPARPKLRRRRGHGHRAREAGDVILAIADGGLTADLIPMRDLLTRTVAPPSDRPLVVKTVGMSWEDVVVVDAVVSAACA